MRIHLGRTLGSQYTLVTVDGQGTDASQEAMDVLQALIDLEHLSKLRGWHLIYAEGEHDDEEVERWCADNLVGQYQTAYGGVIIERDDDAALFRLTFC